MYRDVYNITNTIDVMISTQFGTLNFSTSEYWDVLQPLSWYFCFFILFHAGTGNEVPIGTNWTVLIPVLQKTQKSYEKRSKTGKRT